MTCPICDHTMQLVGGLADRSHVYWCPRCGTLRLQGLPGLQENCKDEAPSLVKRCRKFVPHISADNELLGSERIESIQSAWRRLGIAESINLPENRP